MKISESDIREMVLSSVRAILSEQTKLNEGISDITYHFCTLRNCYNIIKTNSFQLTMSSNRADDFDGKRHFYLSTQRGRSSQEGFGNSRSCNVRIQLDGEKLSQRYKGRPVDYWGVNMGKQTYYVNPEIYGSGWRQEAQHHRNFEMEDRIFSDEPEIKDALSYILRIDIFLDYGNKDWIEQEKKWTYAIFYLMQNYKKPIFIYNSRKDFDAMSDNTINGEFEAQYNSDDYETTRPIMQRDMAAEGGSNIKLEKQLAGLLERLLRSNLC